MVCQHAATQPDAAIHLLQQVEIQVYSDLHKPAFFASAMYAVKNVVLSGANVHGFRNRSLGEANFEHVHKKDLHKRLPGGGCLQDNWQLQEDCEWLGRFMRAGDEYGHMR